VTPGSEGVPDLDTSKLSLVIGRALGTVVVTVDGELDGDGCAALGLLLTDLIDGQGNRAVAVDLRKAHLEPQALRGLLDVARRADRRGTRFVLQAVPTDAYDVLQSSGLAALVELSR
jgi:anti-anti-sigma factor